MMRRNLLVLAVALMGMISGAFAAETSLTGDWKWTVTNPSNNKSREFTAKLKVDADKVKGTVTFPDGKEAEVENGTFKDGTVSFSISRERPKGEGKLTTKFSGKLDDNTITGKLENETPKGGKGQERDWVAKREKA